MKNILLVRHGTTDWVDQQILHGITDIPLNAEGMAQAKETALALKNCGAHAIYSSSLIRCAATAEIIGQSIKLDPILMDSLVELDFGWLEGKRFRDHDKGEYGKLLETIDHWTFTIVQLLSGETKKNLNRRILDGWNSILSDNPNGTIIVVGHSGVFSRILFNYFGKQYLNGESYYHLNPCSITEIQIDEFGQAALVRLNDRSHLNELNK